MCTYSRGMRATMRADITGLYPAIRAAAPTSIELNLESVEMDRDLINSRVKASRSIVYEVLHTTCSLS